MSTSRVRRALVLALVATVFSPIVVLLGLPVPWALRWADPPRTSFMIHREREARRAGETLEIRQEWVPLEVMPDHLVGAVLVAEDDRFRMHGGIDWKALGEEVRYAGADTFSWRSAEDRRALAEALAWAVRNRSELKGRSTLTQQLAKNLYFTPDRSMVRKALEMVVALRLEAFLDKDRILELYLNTVELGPGIFGVGAAARAYFDTPVSELGRFQSASLAATLPHPRTSNPAYRPSRMAWRRDLILARLSGRDVVIPAEPEAIDVPPIEAVPLPATLAPIPESLPALRALADTTVLDTIPPDTLQGGGTPPDSLAPPSPVRPDTGAVRRRFPELPGT